MLKECQECARIDIINGIDVGKEMNTYLATIYE